jgi:hypothetical protein
MTRTPRLIVAAALGLALCACGQGDGGSGGAADGGGLTDPSQAATTLERRFAPDAEAAAATGEIGWSEAYRMGGADGEGETVLTIAGANGLRLDARLIGSLEPGATVAGQSIANLMALGEGIEPAHYSITSQTGGQLCGAATPTDLVAFEAIGSPPETLTLLVTSGGGPGQEGAQLCQVLRYTRTGE